MCQEEEIQTSPAGFGNLDLFSLAPFMDGDDSTRSAIRCIKGEHLTGTYGGIVLSPSVDVEELVMTRYVVDVDDTHSDVLVSKYSKDFFCGSKRY